MQLVAVVSQTSCIQNWEKTITFIFVIFECIGPITWNPRIYLILEFGPIAGHCRYIDLSATKHG